jgi:hypothetical protein
MTYIHSPVTDEKIANHATNMMTINKISQACLYNFSIIELYSDQLISENELCFPKLFKWLKISPISAVLS